MSCAVLTILMLVAGPAQAGQNPVAAYGFNEGTGSAVSDAYVGGATWPPR